MVAGNNRAVGFSLSDRCKGKGGREAAGKHRDEIGHEKRFTSCCTLTHQKTCSSLVFLEQQHSERPKLPSKIWRWFIGEEALVVRHRTFFRCRTDPPLRAWTCTTRSASEQISGSYLQRGATRSSGPPKGRRSAHNQTSPTRRHSWPLLAIFIANDLTIRLTESAPGRSGHDVWLRWEKGVTEGIS